MQLNPAQWQKVFTESKDRNENLMIRGPSETPALWQAVPSAFRPEDPDMQLQGIGATLVDLDPLIGALK
jgi:hypothetical protein